jgi:hypothetical protein
LRHFCVRIIWVLAIPLRGNEHDDKVCRIVVFAAIGGSLSIDLTVEEQKEKKKKSTKSDVILEKPRPSCAEEKNIFSKLLFQKAQKTIPADFRR